jgi:2-polyprenyl-3-methyl-5-hydroxy-6-metoxy-1,4-benzoquinol methylase
MTKQNKIPNKSLTSGERQVHNDLSKVEKHHLWRYNETLKYILPTDNVLDLGTGIGYGAHIIAKKAKQVLGIDDSQEAIDYANKYWKLPNTEFKCMSAFDIIGTYDVIVALEIIEHIKNEKRLFETIKNCTKDRLIFSVPHNSNPIEQYPWHWRHYSEKDIAHKLIMLGFKIERLDVITVRRGKDIFGVAKKEIK